MASGAADHGAHSGRKDGIRLGRIAGIPVYLAYSWFAIAIFIVISNGPMLAATSDLGLAAYLVAFAYAVLLAVSVLVHELAHAFSARLFGWPTDRIVLNLWGGHTQFESFTASPGRSVIVALAGPAANFVLAGAAWPLVEAHVFSGVAETLLNSAMWVNFLIGIFNVLPGLPLDGGRLVESLVWKATGSQEKGTIAAGWTGRGIVVALLALFIVVPWLRGERLDFARTVIAVLVCGFLWLGASAAINQAAMRSRLRFVNAGALAEPAVGVPDTASVADALRLSPEGRPAVVVQDTGGRPRAWVVPSSALAVPPAQQSTTPVTAVAAALAPGAYVPRTAGGQELIQYLARLDGGEYAVVDDSGAVTGLLRQQAVVSAITGKDPRRSGRP
ncbi:site-2 protease family protein [Arthrobacter silvisoli]|uniref:site-2 protease family protein n=1 Tax=Arthrobacter silvisoli TaxID=2291022 RepID=UPI001FE74D41|nr:site-2 protease family protein [Arthrobacter silvisoli]